MTFFILTLIVTALFALVLIYETAGDDSQIRLRPTGLLTWLISGNWPAKVGAGLLIIGIGALLRYAFANVGLSPEAKLGGGVVFSALLGFASMVLRNQPKRRAIYLALGGAAFGVAYLTAYSAYDIFKYLNEVNALALLAIVAVATGVFAMSSNAMSIAILAMVGAYIAPKFAINVPTVSSVYGYYLAASILSLVMVTLRGWRPLIHLSFLFTLAGGLFFGLSAKFYEPAHYSAMQPLLLALTAVHLLMPLLERKHTISVGIARFDALYFVLLPLVAAGLTLKIAPNMHAQGALGLGALAALWGIAAGGLKLFKQNAAGRHAVVAVLLGIAGVLCYAQNVPWLIVGLGLSVAAIAAAPKMDWPRGFQELACGLAAVFGALHIINSIFLPVPADVFLNLVFAYRMIASGLMLLGGWLGIRQSNSFAKILWVTGIAWAGISVLSEILHLHINFMPQLIYGLILGAIFLCILLGNKAAAHPVVGGVFIFALVCCGWWAAHSASQSTVIIYLILTAVVLLGMAWSGRDNAREEASDFSPSMAIGLLPFALLAWASALANYSGIGTDFFEAFVAMAGIAVAGLSARFWLKDSPRWNGRIQPLHVYFTAFVLLGVTLFHIERGIWPVLFEILALVYLIAYITRRSREASEVSFVVGGVMALLVTLVLQAMLLRAFGPDRIMDASDINKMHLRAVVSLLWAVFGAGVAWWGTHSRSRSVWSAGAVLLVVAAVKLVLFDFGALGQLGNILAFIAAGAVFMGVAWFAPIPVKGEAGRSDQSPDESDGHDQQDDSSVSASRPQVQTGSAYQPATSAQAGMKNVVPTAARKTSASNVRYRKEPQGLSWLWLVLLVFAVAVVLFFSALQKQARHKAALRQYQEQLLNANPVEQQTELTAKPETNVDENAGASSAAAASNAEPQPSEGVKAGSAASESGK
jgi:uncharacterized membrane protein